MIWSRLGSYDRNRFEDYLYDSGEHIEQWAHEASIVSSSDWHRSVPRSALEYHFGWGNLAVRRRLRNFQRVYDLTDRIVEARHRANSLQKPDAERELLRKASASLGVATAHDLADYYRMSVRDAVPRIQELVEEGAMIEISVDGWSDTA